MNAPHGGKLIDRVARQNAPAAVRAEKIVDVDNETFQAVENIAYGIYSPLTGFLDGKDLSSCLGTGRLSTGIPWTIPVIFDVDRDQVSKGDSILLRCGDGRAVFHVSDVFEYSKEEYAKKVFGTTDENHPGVKRLNQRKDFLAGGDIILLKERDHEHKKFLVTPQMVRDMFEKRGWKTIAAFQTRNVPHIGHEYIQKTALNLCDGLFISPVIGKKKEGDFQDDLIIHSYRVMVENYFPPQSVVLGPFGYEMQYAGPREAIHHAIIRKNFGCTHFIVGRDHAGVGSYYHPFAAHEIFKEFPDLGIIPIFFSSFFHCNRCSGIASEKNCPHTEDRVEFKGTMLRNIVSRSETPPETLMRPEVVELIKNHPQPLT